MGVEPGKTFLGEGRGQTDSIYQHVMYALLFYPAIIRPSVYPIKIPAQMRGSR